MDCRGFRRTIPDETKSSVVFVVACWFLWKQRNSFVFQQQTDTTHNIVNAVICFAANSYAVSNKQGQLSSNCKGAWSPDPGWTKINSDGAADREGEWAATGGVLRNSDGEWLAGYQRFLGIGSALDSKLWVITAWTTSRTALRVLQSGHWKWQYWRVENAHQLFKWGSVNHPSWKKLLTLICHFEESNFILSKGMEIRLRIDWLKITI